MSNETETNTAAEAPGTTEESASILGMMSQAVELLKSIDIGITLLTGKVDSLAGSLSGVDTDMAEIKRTLSQLR